MKYSDQSLEVQPISSKQRSIISYFLEWGFNNYLLTRILARGLSRAREKSREDRTRPSEKFGESVKHKHAILPTCLNVGNSCKMWLDLIGVTTDDRLGN